MARQKLIDYIKHPALLKDISSDELLEWIEEFPYSQNLRSLYAKKIMDKTKAETHEAYHDAALYSTDRNKLYDQLMQVDNDKKKKKKPKQKKTRKTASSGKEESKNKPLTEDPAEMNEENDGIIIKDGIIDKPKDEVKPDLQDRSSAIDIEKVVQADGIKNDDPILVPESNSEEKEMNMENKEIEQDRSKGLEKSTQNPDPEESENFKESLGSSYYSAQEEKLLSSLESGEIEYKEKDYELSEFSKWVVTLPKIGDSLGSYDFSERKGVSPMLAEQDVISTSLAELLISQGHIEEAIFMYEKLRLKYPEKSHYFAAQIEKLKTS